jgi:formamidopyrimidine-DNA glycosylase
MNRALELGGLEEDFYKQGGHMHDAGTLFIMGYKEGKPCPRCGAAIVKIKTGATATFICPHCQQE